MGLMGAGIDENSEAQKARTPAGGASVRVLSSFPDGRQLGQRRISRCGAAQVDAGDRPRLTGR